jgi:hypothetical protein
MALSGSALVRTSEPQGNVDNSVSGVLDVVIDFFGSRKYRLVLEVRLPDREPYAADGIWKVPTKAAQTGPLRSGGSILPPGVELPVSVADDDPQKIDIDWDTYVGLPGRKKTQRKLYDAYRAAKTQAYVEQHRRR